MLRRPAGGKQEENYLESVFSKIDSGQELSQEDLVCLLALEDERELARLYQAADRVRQKYVGEEIHLRGLIEFSNNCRKNCHYCGIRRDNRKIKRYRMTIEEILKTVSAAAGLGYRTIVLQSGEDMRYTVDELTELLKRIKQEADVAVTLSIGERDRTEYERLYAAGADRYLLRFETSNRDLFGRLHPDSNYDKRLEILSWLREIGYQVGSGVMIGLPGQTVADLARDILKFKELELDMVGVGPYICHEETPLAGQSGGTVEMTFKVIALTRIVTRRTHIPATTALATLRPADGRAEAFQLGANVVMPNVTPAAYRDLYELYPDKICVREDAALYRDTLVGQILALGRRPGRGYGHSLS